MFYMKCKYFIMSFIIFVFLYFQVMLRALKISSSLNLKSIVCVFDQAIYSKAIKLRWKEQEKFNSLVVLMMGMFHMLMMYMHILSKRFFDAGVRGSHTKQCNSRRISR